MVAWLPVVHTDIRHRILDSCGSIEAGAVVARILKLGGTNDGGGVCADKASGALHSYTGSDASPEKAGECLDAAAQALFVIGHELPSVRTQRGGVTRSGEKRLPRDSSRRAHEHRRGPRKREGGTIYFSFDFHFIFYD